MSRRERKKEETRGNIIDTAVSLFEEKGFQETSMEEIAEKSDVSKGTLYNYFQDKESILVGYFQTIIADYFDEIKESLMVNMNIETRLYTLLGLMSKIFKNHDELALIYFKHRMKSPIDVNLVDSSQRSGVEKWVLEIMEKAQENGQLRSDIPALVLTRNFQFLAMSFFVSSIYTKETLDIEYIKTQLIGLFLNGAKQ
ncbi:TetR/AcrR family transcriptional regulator [Clostridium sp.]|uniref:TetR/AcrR family transcriptional regulator n=1 Tax=Clostridium sp. TaxID=1506 RepID=UPI002FCABAEA